MIIIRPACFWHFFQTFTIEKDTVAFRIQVENLRSGIFNEILMIDFGYLIKKNSPVGNVRMSKIILFLLESMQVFTILLSFMLYSCVLLWLSSSYLSLYNIGLKCLAIVMTVHLITRRS